MILEGMYAAEQTVQSVCGISLLDAQALLRVHHTAIHAISAYFDQSEIDFVVGKVYLP